MKLWCLFFI